MAVEIRHATEDDFSRIMEIYQYARGFMAEHGNPKQWGATNWPPQQLIHKDILRKKSHVCVHKGKIVGTFFYDFGENVEKTYDYVENGRWNGNSTYGVVHRIASDGSVKGIGAFCLNWAFAQCGNLRIDTHGDNYVMQKLLDKLGFEHCGTIYVEEDNDPRMAYERRK